LKASRWAWAHSTDLGVGAFILGVGSLVFGCGHGANNAERARPQLPLRTAVGDAGIRELLLDLAAQSACARLRGRFVSLPDGQGGSSNPSPEDGLVAATGRWMLEQCEQSRDGRALRVHLEGPGWQWVEREQVGHRIQQYISFWTRLDLEAELDLAYDPSAKIASIWLTTTGVSSSLTPTSVVHAEARNLAVKVFAGILLALEGSSPDEHARHQVEMEGTALFEASVSNGLTITYDVRRGQTDVILGHLRDGTAPRRPFQGAIPWLVNEKQRLLPGGVQVSGPFDPMSRAVLEVVVERGFGLRYWTACESATPDAIRSVLGAPNAETLVMGAPVVRALSPPPCRWVFVTASAGGDTTAAIEVRAER
jgi:hypothetical protein